MTPAVFARLVSQLTAQPPEASPPPESVPLSRVLPRWAYGALESAREEVILERLATLTAATDPWTAAHLMFGGNR